MINASTNTVVGNPIPVGRNPQGIAYNPNNHDMYVSNFGNAIPLDLLLNFGSDKSTYFNGTVSVINTTSNTVVGNPIPVHGNPQGFVYNANNHDMYVAIKDIWEVGDNGVLVIDSSNNTLVGAPIIMDSHNILTNFHGGDLYFNPLGIGGIAYNSNNHNIYVTNYINNTFTLSVINTSNHTLAGTPCYEGIFSGPPHACEHQ